MRCAPTSNNSCRWGRVKVPWNRGRSTILALLERGELSLVEPSVELATRLLEVAGAHLKLAGSGLEVDTVGSLQLSYDAARKAASALLIAQGLRGTSRGGHIAVLDAVRAQFNDRGGIAVFGELDHLRRQRNANEYPSHGDESVTLNEARAALEIAGEVVSSARALLDSERLSRFG